MLQLRDWLAHYWLAECTRGNGCNCDSVEEMIFVALMFQKAITWLTSKTLDNRAALSERHAFQVARNVANRSRPTCCFQPRGKFRKPGLQ